MGSRDGYVKASATGSADGALPVILRIPIVGGAAATVGGITMKMKLRVVDVWAKHNGGAGETSDTIQVKNGTNAITDAMSWAGADNTVVRAATIDDAQADLDPGDVLNVTTVDSDAGDDVGAGEVYVMCLRVL